MIRLRFDPNWTGRLPMHDRQLALWGARRKGPGRALAHGRLEEGWQGDHPLLVAEAARQRCKIGAALGRVGAQQAFAAARDVRQVMRLRGKQVEEIRR